jgi:hypothetical protein
MAPTAASVKPPELTPVTLLSLVRSAKILDPEYPIHVTLENKEATLTTVRNPKATEQDCKIDAVLVAKTVMDTYPKDVARIKLVLSTGNSDAMHEVTVTTGDIKAYATGTISKDDLLTSLELKKADNTGDDQDASLDIKTEGASAVAPGPFRSQRQLLAARIDKLKANGTGTQPFEEMLAQIEVDVQKPRTDASRFAIRNAIKDLSAHLNEQEQALRDAQHIANGDTRQARMLNLNKGAGQNQKMAGAPGGSPHLGNGVGAAIQARINELRNKGENVQTFREKMNQIKDLRLSNHQREANAARQELMKSLGLDPEQWKNNPAQWKNNP